MTITSEQIAAHAAKNRVSLEIAQSQLEYAARPILAIWRDSHSSFPHRFNTAAEAIDYFHQQWARIIRTTQRERYSASDLRGSFIAGPGFRWTGRDVMLAADVSSY